MTQIEIVTFLCSSNENIKCLCVLCLQFMVSCSRFYRYLFCNDIQCRKCFLCGGRFIVVAVPQVASRTSLAASLTRHCVTRISNTCMHHICSHLGVNILASEWLKWILESVRRLNVTWACNYRLWPQVSLFCKSNADVAEQQWWCRLFSIGEMVFCVCPIIYLVEESLYLALHHCLHWCFLEAWLLHLFHAHFPSPSPVPSGVPTNQRSFDGEAMQGEAQGIMTETAGALVTASLFSKPAQWQSGNFPLNHRKKMVGEHGLHT